MLYRITGRAGSGKTEYVKTLIGEKIVSGAKCVVIVPVQQSMDYEKDVFMRFGSEANMFVEVLTFDRLPNRTYREYGDLAVDYADEGGRALMMSAALENVKPRLKEFASVSGENTFIQKMIDTSRMLKENGVDRSALAFPGDNSRLAVKSREIDMILGEYDSMFSSALRDPRDSLTAYADNLRSMPFFKDKTVFVDSFNSFTEQQQRVLDAIYSQCDDIYVTLCYDPDDRSDMFTNPSLAYSRLARHKKYKDIALCHSVRTPCLAYAEQNIWNDSASPYGGESDIEFIKCASVFEQAEAAAYAAIALASKGMRWRDIVIIARSPENCSGVLDTVLQKHGIPCFISAKEDPLTKPLCVFLLSAVESVAEDFPLRAVIKLIKSGYMPVSSRESELITRYAQTWKIRGKRWTSDSEWIMHPDGFGARDGAGVTRRLEVINNARWKISAVLADFAHALRASHTYAEAAKALYGLLVSVRAAEQVRVKARRLRETGDDAGAQRLTQLWDIVISALEQLHDTLADRPLTLQTLIKRLELVLGTYSLGAVPAVCDSVIIGGASVFRPSSPRAVILFGVNDGEFPASVAAEGVFDRTEINALAKRSIYLEDTFERKIANEKLFFYLASSACSEKLVCIYSETGAQRPSLGAVRLKRLFPGSKETVFASTPETRVFSASSARERSAAADDDAASYLRSLGLDDSLAVKEHPLCDKNANIDYAVGNGIDLSASSLQKYSCCPFSYFANYALRLGKKPQAEFDSLELGNFTHRLLQLFVADLLSDPSLTPLDENKISSLVDRYTEEYILGITKGVDELPKALVYTVSRLKRSMCLLFANAAKEISDSSFVPVALEEPIEHRYVTESGLNVRFRGIADRIDTFEKDGVTYVRIVDYKTGKKKFVKKALDFGLDAQLMIYMDVYLKQHRTPPHMPGGVNYYPAKPVDVSDVDESDPAGVEAALEEKYRRSGLYLADPEVTEALEHGSKGRFIGVKIKKDGGYYAQAPVADQKEFASLLKKTENCLKKTACLIAQGKMNVSPYNGKLASAGCAPGETVPDYNGCKYCDYKSFCRLSGDFTVRRGTPLTGEEG